MRRKGKPHRTTPARLNFLQRGHFGVLHIHDKVLLLYCCFPPFEEAGRALAASMSASTC